MKKRKERKSFEMWIKCLINFFVTFNYLKVDCKNLSGNNDNKIDEG